MGQAQEGWQSFSLESKYECFWITDQCVQRLETVIFFPLKCLHPERQLTYRDLLPRLTSCTSPNMSYDVPVKHAEVPGCERGMA